MAEDVHIGFERQVVSIRLTDILPLRRLAPNVARSKRYGRIITSIAEVGIIEPLPVSKPNAEGKHLLLDGHLRYYALCERGEESVRCVIEDDDESFTYNKRVNRLATVQEHYMIERALERGASAEKIARALGMDIRTLTKRRTMLDGIAPEVIELLKDRTVSKAIFDALRKMKPLRQYEAADLMIQAGNLTTGYAKALLAGTKQTDLVAPEKPKRLNGLSPEQMARMERELEVVSRDFKAVERTFGDDVLHLVLASRYVGRLMANTNVVAYLEKRHGDMLTELRAIVLAASLEPGPAV
ncbi:ParB N-terminal domain-containing protein [Aureimonas sp. OT7]|uniref:plasmid partitioning protein RepB C-terminal domain-containing protein n=1 Tax=Aureimonas sp. OT7 TaxID=2816454 RepID=UPI0017804235|nr:plasmid partitioning protein RepB C-terminal domain-containing protein [Aureimonas sp. OT7]QOG06563.1 ParB N-terminal domain-containing protein [Aureimonas sp. OT7]